MKITFGGGGGKGQVSQALPLKRQLLTSPPIVGILEKVSVEDLSTPGQFAVECAHGWFLLQNGNGEGILSYRKF